MYVNTYARIAPIKQFKKEPTNENKIEFQNDFLNVDQAILKFSPIILNTFPSSKPNIPFETIFAFVLHALSKVMNNERRQNKVHKIK